MMLRLGVLCWGLLSLGLLGCSANTAAPNTAQPPSWVLSPPTETGMAYGIGSMENYGDSAAAMKRAVELARVDLVSQLRVTVSGQFSQDSTVTRSAGQSTMQQQLHQQVQNRIPTVELSNLEIADTWHDDRRAYALVQMDRVKAASQLRLNISEIDQELDELAELTPSGRPLARLQPLLPALTLLAKREQLNDKLALVSPNGRGEPLSPEIKQLQQRIDQQLDELKVQVSFTDTDAQILAPSVLASLTQQGFKLGSQDQADVRFVVSATLTQTQRQGSYYSFAHCQIQLEDDQGRVLSAFSQQAKGVSGLPERSQQKAAQQLAHMLSQELAKTLVEKLQ